MKEYKEKVKRNYTIEDLEQLLDNIPYEVYMKDLDGKYTYANKACADRVNLKKEEIIGRRDYDFRTEEMAKICIEGDKAVLAKGKDTFIEDRITDGDIETAYELFKTIVYNSETQSQMIGRIAKFIITDRSMSKYLINNFGNLMNNSEELNNSIVNNEILSKLNDATKADDVALYIYDVKTRKMDMDTYIGKNNLLFPKQYVINDDIKELYFENKECEIIEEMSGGGRRYIYLLKNSSRLLGCMHVYYKREPDDLDIDFIKYICLILSFIEAKKILADNLSEELKMRKETQKKLQMMIDSTIDIYGLAQTRGNKFVWLETSRRCREIIGWTVKELNTRNYLEFIHPKDRKRVEETVLLNRNKSCNFMFSVLCKDGTWKTLDTCVNYLTGNIYMIGAKDITLLTELKKDKKELEVIVEREALKTEFFANLSHEFKTPLNIILSTVQVILEFMKTNSRYPDYEKFDKYMKSIKQNSYRLVKLTNNIIDMTKIDGGFYEINMGNYNIVEIIENIVQSVAGYIKDNKRNIVFDTEEEEIMTACDPTQIERIILNILSNAMKFTYAGGNISVNMDVSRENDKVIISIGNDGQPLNADDTKKIFERFTQSEQLFTRSAEGSGIGLALVKSLVEMHGGRIYVNTEVIEGTEFCIELPIRKIMNSRNHCVHAKNLNSKVEKFAVEFSDIYD